MPFSVLIYFSITSVSASIVLPRQQKVLLCRSQKQEPKKVSNSAGRQHDRLHTTL
ncbi:hypothetical protein BCR43DRAFT_493792, partial [Syncephalastrum racemosum]